MESLPMETQGFPLNIITSHREMLAMESIVLIIIAKDIIISA
jgi:hypothetical protein